MGFGLSSKLNLREFIKCNMQPNFQTLTQYEFSDDDSLKLI
jgi:hypothetical protein